MLDVFNTPQPITCDTQQFFVSGTWVKPRGVSQAYIVLIGAGGGGRQVVAAGTTSGGGGGSGAMAVWFGPTMFLPDTLSVTVGTGGIQSTAGGATSISAFVGGTSYTVLTANGGSGATSATGAAGGTASTANYFCSSGLFQFTAGTAGGTGATAVTATLPISGGGGGASTAASQGGSVIPIMGYATVPGGTAGGVVPGGDGFTVFTPFFLAAGGAGGSTNDTIGSTGGAGGIGSGGGGAGEDSTIAGRGGNGYAVIISW